MKKVKKMIPIELGKKNRKNKPKEKPLDYTHEYRVAVSLFCLFSLIYIGVLLLVSQYRIDVIDELGQWGLPTFAAIWFLGSLV